MKVHEYQAKEVLARYGVPVPRGRVATTPRQAAEIARELGGRSIVKAQVHAGGRGKAGGIRVVSSPEEASAAASALIGTRLVTFQTGPDGVPVHSVLVGGVVEVESIPVHINARALVIAKQMEGDGGKEGVQLIKGLGLVAAKVSKE